jgi:hypothetical protein
MERGSEYTECQAFCPKIVRIRSPHPLALKRVLLPPFGSKGGDTLACGGGVWGDPILTKGQTLWNSKKVFFLVIPLRRGVGNYAIPIKTSRIISLQVQEDTILFVQEKAVIDFDDNNFLPFRSKPVPAGEVVLPSEPRPKLQQVP